MMWGIVSIAMFQLLPHPLRAYVLLLSWLIFDRLYEGYCFVLPISQQQSNIPVLVGCPVV